MVSAIDNSSWFSIKPVDLNTEKDFNVSVIAKWQEGIENNRFGIQFCSDRNGENYMFFGVSANGYYIIADYKGGKWYPMKDWTQSDKVNKKYVPNLLVVKKEGKFIGFYINEQLVFTMPFEGGYGRQFGFRINEKQTVEFDRLEIKGSRFLIPSKEGLVKTEPILNDPFNINSGWPVVDHKDIIVKQADGKFRFIGINKERTYWSTRSFPIDLDGNFSVYTKVKWINGVNNHAFGFAYGGTADHSPVNYFAISSNGYFSHWMNTHIDGKQTIPWTFSQLVKQGSVVNEIEMRKIGKEMEFYINGQMADKIPCPPLIGNFFGFKTSNAQEVEFDDFIIRQLK